MDLWIFGIGLILAALASFYFIKPSPISNIKSCLLVTAHPDDECMFFSPILLHLARQKIKVSVLCLSNGNADGLGKQREKELVESTRLLGVPSERVFVLNQSGLQDGSHAWDPSVVASTVQTFIEKSRPELLITFDDHGVSGHMNHISIFQGIKRLKATYSSPPLIYTLTSVPLFRKYTSFVDILATLASATDQDRSTDILALSSFQDYMTARRAMFAHSSQLVWFRHLYICASRYMVMNDLKRLD